LDLSPEQQILFYKLDKAKSEFILANRERQEKASKSLPPIFGFDLMSVSSEFKLLYLLIVFALFALGIAYALGKVKGNRKEVKDKKKKK
jgi:hypothetical protein